MARGADRVRLLRQDLLATARRVARGRGRGPAAPGVAGAPPGRGGAGLEPGSARQCQPAREKGGAEVGPDPTDRGKPGTKRHLVTGARGTPLGLTLSGANRHDSRMLVPTLDAVPGVRARHRGRPRRRPTKPGKARFALPRRQGLRSPPLPPRVPCPRHHPTHCKAGCREQHPPGPSQVGGGAHLRLARPVPASDRPLRAPRRPPPRPHNPRLRRHLPPPDQEVLSLL